MDRCTVVPAVVLPADDSWEILRGESGIKKSPNVWVCMKSCWGLGEGGGLEEMSV
jgi:hypothetical protein